MVGVQVRVKVWEGSRFGVKVMVKVGGSRSGSRLWGQGQGHDWWSQGRGQGQGIGHGVKSGEGSRFGVQVGGQGLWRGKGLGVKVVAWLSGQGQGHDRWSQGLESRSGSRSGEWSRSWGGGQCLSDWGQMVGGGRLEINSLFLSRTHDRIEFHSIPFHSIPFYSIPIHSIPFHSIPFHVLPNAE